jgi:hypothetical protein
VKLGAQDANIKANPIGALPKNLDILTDNNKMSMRQTIERITKSLFKIFSFLKRKGRKNGTA